MNRYSSISVEQRSNRRKPMPGSAANRRVRLSVARWQQAQFVPVIVRQAPVSRLNFSSLKPELHKNENDYEHY
jgi:hypothetical protein